MLCSNLDKQKQASNQLHIGSLLECGGLWPCGVRFPCANQTLGIAIVGIHICPTKFHLHSSLFHSKFSGTSAYMETHCKSHLLLVCSIISFPCILEHKSNISSMSSQPANQHACLPCGPGK